MKQPKNTIFQEHQKGLNQLLSPQNVAYKNVIFY